MEDLVVLKLWPWQSQYKIGRRLCSVVVRCEIVGKHVNCYLFETITPSLCQFRHTVRSHVQATALHIKYVGRQNRMELSNIGRF